MEGFAPVEKVAAFKDITIRALCIAWGGYCLFHYGLFEGTIALLITLIVFWLIVGSLCAILKVFVPLAVRTFPVIVWLSPVPLIWVRANWIAVACYLLLPIFIFKLLTAEEIEAKQAKEITEQEIQTLVDKGKQYRQFYHPGAYTTGFTEKEDETIRDWAVKHITHQRNVLSLWEIKNETKLKFLVSLMLITVCTYIALISIE